MQLEAPPAAESEPTDSTVKDVISQVVSEVAQQYDQHAAVSEEAAHQGATVTTAVPFAAFPLPFHCLALNFRRRSAGDSARGSRAGHGG